MLWNLGYAIWENPDLDDLSNEPNNIKAGCCIGEVLSNHLMLADDICVFCPSVRGLQNMLDVWEVYAKLYGIICQLQQNCVWCLRLGVQKLQLPHYWHWVVKM